MTDIIKPATWSFSRLKDFERCKLAYKLKYIDRVPEPERPLPPGRSEHANDRGSRIHDAAERFVNGTGPFAPEMKEFEPEFNHLKQLYAAGKVSLEGEWGFDKNWETTPWKSAWCRLKLDVMVHASNTEAVVIDLKTGKRWGNEIHHAQQLQFYSLVSFLRYPRLEVIHAELYYLDVKELALQTYTRDQALRFRRSFNQRGLAVTENKLWPANPNKWSCMFCAYGPEHTGDCTVGVRKA